MKNNTFNQVINANLASIDPGFGQFGRGSKRNRGLPLFTYAGYPSSTARLRAAARSRGPRVT